MSTAGGRKVLSARRAKVERNQINIFDFVGRWEFLSAFFRLYYY